MSGAVVKLKLLLNPLMNRAPFLHHQLWTTRGMSGKGPAWPPPPWAFPPDPKLYQHLTNKQRKDQGFPCNFDDPVLLAECLLAKQLIRQFNDASVEDQAGRLAILKKLLNPLSSMNINIEPPFLVDHGINITVGDGFFANFGCCFLDTAPITIGKNVMIAPRVNLFTTTHPLHPGERLEYALAKSITIGNDVWIGGGATILPGVTIGDGVVVAGAAAVTKNVPSFCVVGGNPAKIIRYLPGASKPK